MNAKNEYLNLTPAQKAGRTNHERAEREKQRWRQTLEENRLICAEMNALLRDPAATPAEKLRAAELLTKLRERCY